MNIDDLMTARTTRSWVRPSLWDRVCIDWCYFPSFVQKQVGVSNASKPPPIIASRVGNQAGSTCFYLLHRNNCTARRRTRTFPLKDPPCAHRSGPPPGSVATETFADERLAEARRRARPDLDSSGRVIMFTSVSSPESTCKGRSTCFPQCLEIWAEHCLHTKTLVAFRGLRTC